MFKKFLILSTIFIISSSFDLQAQVRVVKSAKDRNPTLLFRDITGNPELSKLIESDLKNCGWFDMVDSGAEYVITGAASGSQLQTNVCNGNGSPVFSLNTQINPQNSRTTAHKTVDAILKKMFNIAGICSSKIAFSAQPQVGKKEIYTCDFDGQNITQLTFNNSLSVEPKWIPGRDAIVFTLYSKMFTDVVELDINSKRCRRIAQFPGLNSQAVVSPNGSQMAIILSRDRQVELYVKPFLGQSLQRLTNGIGVEASPCWSPTGDKLCFVSDMGGRPGLYLINPAGGSPVRLSTQGSEAVSPSWSSDNKIAYSAKMGSYAIAILDLNGKEAGKTVVNAAGDWESPSWAPDARHVVCTRTSGGSSALFIVDTWTGRTRQLIGGKMNTVLPNWSGIK